MAFTEIKDSSVKFYASLTRKQALGLDPVTSSGYKKTLKTKTAVPGVSFYYSDESCTSDYLVGDTPNWDTVTEYYYLQYFVEPGAICYVSDTQGNSIFLNGLLFGDGAKAGSGGSGGGGITEVTLDMIPVITTSDGTVTKTLDAYFSDEGTFTPTKIDIFNGSNLLALSISSTGITIGGDTVVVQGDLASINQEISGLKSSITSIYKYKASVSLYSDLAKITNPSNGDVYNVVSATTTTTASGDIITTPAGTNYAAIVTEDENGVRSVTWDALGGSFNFSNYYTKTEVDGIKDSILSSLTTYIDGIFILKGYDTKIENNALAISNLSTTVNQHTTSINTLATYLKWQ